MSTLHPSSHPRSRPSAPPASPHSYGHAAGLHGEDRPYQSQDLASSSLLSTPTPPSQERERIPAAALPRVTPQGKLVLPMPAPAESLAASPSSPRPPGKHAFSRFSPPQPPPPLGQLATIGYQQPGARAVLHALLQHQEERWLLVDIRETPWSYYPEWLGCALAEQFTTQYRHVPELGIPPNADTSLPMQVPGAKEGIRCLLPLLESGQSCLLLCGCPTWQTCHRALVANLLQQARPALQVWHLTCEVMAAQAVEVQATSRGELGVSLDLTLAYRLHGEEEAYRERLREETILVTPLTLSVRVPGRGVIRRQLDFVSWPQGGRPTSAAAPLPGSSR